MRESKPWNTVGSAPGPGIGPRASIGMIALSTDRVGVWDLEQYLASIPEVAVFSTRVPMSSVGTPETLREVRNHLTAGTELLVTGSRLDVIGFSCTSGTVAIGLPEVHAAINAARPGTPVCTPIEAGLKALKRFGAKRISVLAPYRIATAELISGFFEDSGMTVDRKTTFDLDGDPEMNMLDDRVIAAAAKSAVHADSDALFISCTGLATSGIVNDIETAIGKPVVTSNQALAWDCVRTAGVQDKRSGLGRLFRDF